MMNYVEQVREFMRRDRVFDFMLDDMLPVVNVDKNIILYVEGLTVSFDGFKALDNLNLYINDGELRCLIGANGAGKTTFMDCITGKTRPDSGSVYFGQTINLLDKAEADIVELGIGRKFQKPSVFENHSVYENLELAFKTDKAVLPTIFSVLTAEHREWLFQVLELIGLQEVWQEPAGALSHGQKQWLEIGILLASNPRVLLVDEPVAGMTPQETERTAELLTSLAGEHTVIVVEHDMAFVRSIAREVTVLHQGSVLAEGSMSDVQNDQRVIEVYLGEPESNSSSSKTERL